jgi:general secretion pathway protein K
MALSSSSPREIKNTESFSMFSFLKCKGKTRAFALVSVLIMVSILSFITLEFTRSSGINLRMAINYSISKKALYYAFGGYKTALTVLMIDDNDYDGPGDYWFGVLPPIPLEDGVIIVTIEDEKARYNVQELVTDFGVEDKRRRVMLERIFETLDIETNLIDAITDWQDSDTLPLAYGAESLSYTVQTPSYEPSNKPVRTTGELLLIKNVERDLLFLPPSARNSFSSEDLEPLEHYLTAYGDGRININTAKYPVLLSLSSDMDENIVDDIIEYREEQSFQSLEELKNLETISDILYDEIASLLTVNSDIFRITSTGTVGGFVRTITAVVLRESQGVRVVYFNRSL